MKIQRNSPADSSSDKLRGERGANLSRSWTLILLAWLVCRSLSPQQIFAGAEPEADRQDYSPEELVATLTETLTSIDSLYCEFVQVQKKGNATTSPLRCRYARFGDKWHNAEFSAEDDKESVVCFDGERVYSYFITRSPDGKVRFGTVQIHDFQDPPLISPEYMIGMRLSDLQKSIPAVCQTNKITSVATNIVDGTRTLRLLVGSIPNGNTPEGKVYAYDVTFDLDPAHGLLPSNTLLEFSPETKAFVATHRSWYQRWRMPEFRRVLDESTNMERWFPSKGILEQGGAIGAPTYELSLENVRLNANLEESLFNPKIPSGTTIFNMTSEGRGRATLAGGNTAVDKRITVLANKARAVGGRSFWNGWIVSANLLVLTLVAFVLWWRRKPKTL